MKAYLSQSTSDAEIERRRAIYQSLLADTNYQNIRFNPQNGGLMATHIDHCFNITNGQYEKEVQKIAFEEGHSVILTSEKGKQDGQKYVDGLWDGMTFEVGTSLGVGKNNIKGILKHCQSKNAEIAVIYFPDKNLFSMERLIKGILQYEGQTDYSFAHIIYIVEEKCYWYKIKKGCVSQPWQPERNFSPLKPVQIYKQLFPLSIC